MNFVPKGYIVRPSTYGGKWVAQTPRGVATQHDSQAEAVRYTQYHSAKKKRGQDVRKNTYPGAHRDAYVKPKPIEGEKLPALYKLNHLVMMNGVKRFPQFPLQIIPYDNQEIAFLFWGTRNYNSYIAFTQSTMTTRFARVSAINYTICVNGKGYVFKHHFKQPVHLTRAGIRGRSRIMKPHGQLEGLPKLPSDWQYFQFVG